MAIRTAAAMISCAWPTTAGSASSSRRVKRSRGSLDHASPDADAGSSSASPVPSRRACSTRNVHPGPRRPRYRSHARRTNRVYCLDGSPLWGVSAFGALDEVGPVPLKGLLASRLLTYKQVHTPEAQTLLDAGFMLLDSFRRPHFTIRLVDDSPAEASRLLSARPADREPVQSNCQPAPRRDTMTTVDITADLNDEDETGFVWTFLDEARDPTVITPGAIVIDGMRPASRISGLSIRASLHRAKLRR
jgi:hypothetical protein